MTHTPDVKICGLSTPETLQTAIESGARFVGFVFYPPSPRNISFDTAFELARQVPTGVRTTALFVDPDDILLERVLTGIQIDLVQLHGNETPERITEIKNRFHIPVMKAIRVATPDDLKDIEAYEKVADWLLFDTKVEALPSNQPISQSASQPLPGGTGQSFDWNLLKDKTFQKPWMLGGGLNADNIGEALSTLSPTAVDISSGVESAPGIKDPEKIKTFIAAVKSARP